MYVGDHSVDTIAIYPNSSMSNAGVYVVHLDMISLTKSLTSLAVDSVTVHLFEMLGSDLRDLQMCAVSTFSKWM